MATERFTRVISKSNEKCERHAFCTRKFELSGTQQDALLPHQLGTRTGEELVLPPPAQSSPSSRKQR